MAKSHDFLMAGMLVLPHTPVWGILEKLSGCPPYGLISAPFAMGVIAGIISWNVSGSSLQPGILRRQRMIPRKQKLGLWIIANILLFWMCSWAGFFLGSMPGFGMGAIVAGLLMAGIVAGVQMRANRP